MAMIPLGYMLKSVAERPDWLKAPAVRLVHSVSGCVSEDVADPDPEWRHNGWWFFDTAALVRQVADELGADPGRLTLFYYEAFDREYDHDAGDWLPYERNDDVETAVVPPARSTLRGFDVVSVRHHNQPEHSPLSCNHLAEQLPTNAFCLFDSLDEARVALEAGLFRNAEPGPYRIVAVHTVEG